MAPLPTRILRAGGIARSGVCEKRRGRRGSWSLQVQHRAAADLNIERASICVCVYEITPYARINIIRKLEVAPPTSTFLGPADRPADFLQPGGPTKTPIAENNAPPGLRSLLGKPDGHRPGRASPGLTVAYQLAILLDVVVSPHGRHSQA